MLMIACILLFKKNKVLINQQGWQYNISEGGCISPDRSTIFVDFRDPYYGQLMCRSGAKQNEYENIVNMFMESGDFVEIK